MMGLEQFLATALLPGSWPLSFHWTTSAVSTLGGEHFLRLSPTSSSSCGMPAVSFDSLNSNSVTFLLNVYYSLKTITTSCKGSHLFCPNSFSQFWSGTSCFHTFVKQDLERSLPHSEILILWFA
uniref:Uncharacterized protein n=1 Tax=Rousettus aegyptiacus TaxID=9407 RepID=A0A7J8KAQ8_ROUAE|nr:hypothetical protein HJG63_007832 [Rousettus aegyptiacus]